MLPRDKPNYLFAINGGDVSIQLLDHMATANGHKQNIIFGPASVRNCMGLAYAGGRNETIYEITSNLRFVSIYPADVGKHFQFVLDKYKNSEVVNMVNKVYVQEGQHIKEEYKESLRQYYYAEADYINFTQAANAAELINACVADKTNGKITKLIASDALNQNTCLVLLSAIHFKGQWVQQFDTARTKEDEFWISKDQSVQVEYMHQQAKFGYACFEELACTALEMPYKDSDLSMLVLLPNERNGLQMLIENLKDPYVHLIFLEKKITYEHEIVVKFPKFKAEFEVELSDVMQKMYIKTMFSTSAQFDNMLESPENICVSKIFHKACIEVNEEGTEAAAATGISMMNYSMRIPTQFQADHPFVYIIWNKLNVLFMGTFVNAPTTA